MRPRRPLFTFATWGVLAALVCPALTAAEPHDARTGEVLATFDLPAGLHGGPITYKLTPGGKQYLVVAAGGHTGLDSKLGDYVIAYTLAE